MKEIIQKIFESFNDLSVKKHYIHEAINTLNTEKTIINLRKFKEKVSL